MIQSTVIRDETGADFQAIAEVTKLAFVTMEISNHTEHYIVDALRDANALTVSLVAEFENRVVGHIAFSPVTISDGTSDWYGLGPISVHPDHQLKGIGKALIRTGLSRLKDLNAGGCCLVGYPEYYRKLGFQNVSDLGLEGIQGDVFFVYPFRDPTPRGTVTFHEAFKADGR